MALRLLGGSVPKSRSGLRSQPPPIYR